MFPLDNLSKTINQLCRNHNQGDAKRIFFDVSIQFKNEMLLAEGGTEIVYIFFKKCLPHNLLNKSFMLRKKSYKSCIEKQKNVSINYYLQRVAREIDATICKMISQPHVL